MHDISTPLLPAHAEHSAPASPRPLTLSLIRQFARVYVPTLGGIILN